MKKSKSIQLVLITAALASCSTQKKDDWSASNGGKTYVRGDSTAPYQRTHHHGMGMWFYAFRPLYGYNNGIFGRTGFYSDAISRNSNFGTNSTKSRSVRGGFGRSHRVGG
jgi:hypothetical protein